MLPVGALYVSDGGHDTEGEEDDNTDPVEPGGGHKRYGGHRKRQDRGHQQSTGGGGPRHLPHCFATGAIAAPDAHSTGLHSSPSAIWVPRQLTRDSFCFEPMNPFASTDSLPGQERKALGNEASCTKPDPTRDSSSCIELQKRKREPESGDILPFGQPQSKCPKIDSDQLAVLDDLCAEDLDALLETLDTGDQLPCSANPVARPVNHPPEFMFSPAWREVLVSAVAPVDYCTVRDARGWAKRMKCTYFTIFIEEKQKGIVYRIMIYWTREGRKILMDSSPTLREIIDQEIPGPRAAKKYLRQLRFPVRDEQGIDARERTENFNYVERLCIFLKFFMQLEHTERTQTLCSIDDVITEYLDPCSDLNTKKNCAGYRVRSCAIMIALFEYMVKEVQLLRAVPDAEQGRAEQDGHDGPSPGRNNGGAGYSERTPSEGPSEGPPKGGSGGDTGSGYTGGSGCGGDGGDGSKGGRNNRDGDKDDNRKDDKKEVERVSEMKQRLAMALAPKIAAIARESEAQQRRMIYFIKSFFSEHPMASVQEIIEFRPEVSERLQQGKAKIAAVSEYAFSLRPTVTQQCQLLVRAVNEEWQRASQKHVYITDMSFIAAGSEKESSGLIVPSCDMDFEL